MIEKETQLMKNYCKTTFSNGEELVWRLRDADYNRFKVLLTYDQVQKLKTWESYNDVGSPDDCSGEEFATINRLLAHI